jgi:CheY-like chemotaxis protein
MRSNKTKLDVLFIEDNPEDAELAVLNLVQQGFRINWERVDNESDLRCMLGLWDPDLIVSDYSMPGFSGRAALQICKEMTPEIPFIFVSGTIGEERAIEAIHDGATDYVLKDNMRRLGTSVNRAVIDAIERQRAREAGLERNRLIKVLEVTSDLVVLTDPDGLLIYVNDGARQLLGLNGEMALMTINRFVSKEKWQCIRDELPLQDNEDGVWRGDTVLHDDNEMAIPVSLVVIAHREQGPDIKYFSFIARDARNPKSC